MAESTALMTTTHMDLFDARRRSLKTFPIDL